MKKFFLLVMLITIFVFQLNAGSFSNVFISYQDEQYTKEQVLRSFSDLRSLPAGSELAVSRDVSDDIGMRHYTYQQYVNGVKVEGCYLLLHEKDGYIKSVNGRLLEDGDMPVVSAKPNLRKRIMQQNTAVKDENIELVLFEYNEKYYSAYKYFDKDKYANIYVDSESGDVIAEISLVNHADANGTAYTYYYGWKNIVYDNTDGVNTLLDNSRNIYTIDASGFDGVNDNTLNDYTNPNSEWYVPLLTSVTLTWAAQSWWYNALTDANPDFYIKVKRNGVVLYESGYYDNTNPPVTFNIPVAIEADGNISIEVCDYDGTLGSDDTAGAVKITKTTAGTFSWNNSKTQATYTISKAPHGALDVHWGMEKVYDFYLAKFNHRSFDGNGGQILQLVNPPSNVSPFSDSGFPNNACALGGTGLMAYGFGDGTDFNPFVTIDAMGHEFTHMVTAANGSQNLPNYGEGGALNESFADIIGNAVEEYATGSADWLVAAGVSNITANHALRSMSDPKSMGSPNTYKGTNWKTVTGNPTGDNDMDGVHSNCGVQNYWAYLLTYGGNGYIDGNSSKGAYNVVGIGMDKTIQIAYRNLLYYITSSSNHTDSRNGAIQAAIDLYGADSQEHQSVANAWYAVGVGSKYVPPQSAITVKAKMPSNWGNTISAWAWETGAEGSWVTLKKEGGWYSCTLTSSPVNIVYVNGTTWNGDNNQTVDITLSADACLQVGSNTTGKRTYTIVDCGSQSDRYVVVAQRSTSSNWFYMTSDLGTASNKRYQAVDAGSSAIASVTTSNLDDKYYWEIEGNKLKSNVGYSTWSSGNTANFNSTGKELNIQKQTDGTYTFSFADGDNTRYLALNKTAGNNYFAYYSGTNQVYKLTLIKEGESGSTTAIEDVMSEQPSATKIFRDGQIYIIRGEQVYDLQGRLVK